LAAALSLALAATLTPDFAEAKRLGGGKSFGMQRTAPAKPAPQQNTPPSPAQQATPGQTAPTAAPATAGATAAAAAAAPAKRSWMGPIAGLAAGLGLAALASHFGFGEGLANFLMIALLAVAAVFLVRFVMARMGGSRQQPAMAGAAAGAGASPSPLRVEPQMPVQRSAMPTAPVAPAAPATGGEVSVTGVPLAPMSAAAAATAVAAEAQAAPAMTLPEGFDLPAFERVAKMIFIRLQAANDTADLDDLREFTTPEMFAAIRLELQERGGVGQQTDVERVDAQLIDFVTEPTRQIASVRFHGLIREERDGQAEAFDEVWHLVKPADDSRTWAISGIQQSQ
jgi:predicted lipid-binding transport protein (Tim44 family)